MKECTVFVCTNPAEPIPAARFELDDLGQGHFVYGKSYLANPAAFAFDPVNLRLTPDQLRIAVHGDETFGVLSDAGPNTWGKRITGSICKQENKPVVMHEGHECILKFNRTDDLFDVSAAENTASHPHLTYCPIWKRLTCRNPSALVRWVLPARLKTRYHNVAASF